MSSDAKKNLTNGDLDKLSQRSPHTTNPRHGRRPPSNYQGSGMTPSIITTINNTNPDNPPENHPSIVNSNVNNTFSNKHNRRAAEPYESYIEDSFVGHWEHEDDEDEYQEDFDADSHAGGGNEREKSNLQHPSTIEFDFDSFGPESFIYTPTATTDGVSSTKDSKSSKEEPIVDATSPNSSESLSSAMTVRQPSDQESTSDKIGNDKKQTDDSKDQDVLKESPGNTNRAQYNNLQRNDSDDSRYSPSGQSHHRNLKPQFYLVDPAQIDMKVIEPYKKVISHAGYCHFNDPSLPATNPNDPVPAVIVFSACYLPDRSRRDYNYVMDHLFLYVLTSLHELIADDYILIYLHNTQPNSGQSSSIASRLSASINFASSSSYSTYSSYLSSSTTAPSSSQTAATAANHVIDETQHQNNLPTFSWMKRCYQMIDRRLRKNLRILYLVKPTFWLKTVVIMCKPFISAKFSKKLRFVEDMNALKKCLPIDKLILPASADHI